VVLLIITYQVENIIREENMMAAQEIIELFCELITVRLPIIETQRLFLTLHYLAFTMFVSCLLMHSPVGYLS
jgi:hypothetical protein